MKIFGLIFIWCIFSTFSYASSPDIDKNEEINGSVIADLQSQKLEKLKIAAEKGDGMALYKYADEVAYADPRGIKAAIPLYSKAGDKGNIYGLIAFVTQNLAHKDSITQEDKTRLDGLCKEYENDFEKMIKNVNTDSDAAYTLADACQYGICVPEDSKKHQEYLEMAAQQGHDKAQYLLGLLYTGNKESAHKAIELYKKAASQGLSIAALNLARCYLSGKGVEKNTEKGLKILEDMALKNDGKAQMFLGLAYYKGRYGLPENMEKAKYWLEKAAAHDMEQAKKLLKKISK